MKTAAAIELEIIAVLKEVQTLSGRPWVEPYPTTIPIRDIEGFDSLCSVEATGLVESRLGAGALKPASVFISDDGKRPLTISEVAALIQSLIK